MAVTVKLSDAAKQNSTRSPSASRVASTRSSPVSGSGRPCQARSRCAGRSKGSYRIRTSDYRVIFTVVGDTITVTRVGIRRDVYED